MRYILLFISVIFLDVFSHAQIIESYNLPEELNEASGIEQLNDSVFISINDGGNKPIIYLISEKGKLLKKIRVKGSKNKDWEELTRDKNHLYIGEFGNNKNKRKSLAVLKIKISDVIQKDTVIPEKIFFNYANQINFPPEKKDFEFDAEAMFCRGDSIIILTKTNSEPWNGKTCFYSVSKTPGVYSLKKTRELFIGENGWFIDAVTAADYCNEKLYIMTYNRVLMFKYAENKLVFKKEYVFDKYSQKEGLLILSSKKVLVVDEKSPIIGGGKLYKINIK